MDTHLLAKIDMNCCNDNYFSANLKIFKIMKLKSFWTASFQILAKSLLHQEGNLVHGSQRLPLAFCQVVSQFLVDGVRGTVQSQSAMK